MPETQAPPTRSRLRAWLLLGVRTALGLWAGWWLWNVLAGPNLHVVLPGQIYRGSQPTPASLEALVRRYGIRTVVNLRGCCETNRWYLRQARAVQRLGIGQEDVSFSATRLPSKDELRVLIDVLDRAERPLFLHCRHGADRTGLAAAVALLLDGTPYDEARPQLSLRYGHVPFGRTARLSAFFDLYEDWLSANGYENSAQKFRHWALYEYEGGWCQARFEAVEPLQALRANRPNGLRVKVRNPSDYPWRFNPHTTAGVHLLFWVWDEQGQGVADGRGGYQDLTVGPGERAELTLVLPPLPAGRYRLLVDLVDEYHCWFYQAGSTPWEQELEIRE